MILPFSFQILFAMAAAQGWAATAAALVALARRRPHERPTAEDACAARHPQRPPPNVTLHGGHRTCRCASAAALGIVVRRLPHLLLCPGGVPGGTSHWCDCTAAAARLVVALRPPCQRARRGDRRTCCCSAAAAAREVVEQRDGRHTCCCCASAAAVVVTSWPPPHVIRRGGRQTC